MNNLQGRPLGLGSLALALAAAEANLDCLFCCFARNWAFSEITLGFQCELRVGGDFFGTLSAAYSDVNCLVGIDSFSGNWALIVNGAGCFLRCEGKSDTDCESRSDSKYLFHYVCILNYDYLSNKLKTIMETRLYSFKTN